MPAPAPTDPEQDAREAQVSRLVRQVILNSSGRQIDPGPEDPLIADGALDSLSIAELVLQLQASFGVEFFHADLSEESFGSVRAIAQLIARRQAA